MNDEPLDACLRLVSDRHRRGVIQQLRGGATGETTVDDLVDRLHDGEPIAADGGPAKRGRLVAELHHTHLPKLADHGVVGYDPGAGTVRYRGDEQVEAVLDSLPEEVAAANP